MTQDRSLDMPATELQEWAEQRLSAKSGPLWGLQKFIAHLRHPGQVIVRTRDADNRCAVAWVPAESILQPAIVMGRVVTMVDDVVVVSLSQILHGAGHRIELATVTFWNPGDWVEECAHNTWALTPSRYSFGSWVDVDLVDES